MLGSAVEFEIDAACALLLWKQAKDPEDENAVEW